LTTRKLPYLAMEYLEGVPLAYHTKEGGRLPLEAALRIGRQLAAALAAAHARHVIHRDLKPENIICMESLGEQGSEHVKIVDFGIACIDTQLAQKRLTRSGVFLGTPCYMAPEMVRDSRAASDRSDVYALGVMLYQMLVGEPPFQATIVGALLFQQVGQEPPSLGQHFRGMPLLCALVDRMLAKAPAERPTMLEVKTSLAQLERSLTEQTRMMMATTKVRVTSRSARRRAPRLLPSLLVGWAALLATPRLPSRSSPAEPRSEVVPARASELLGKSQEDQPTVHVGPLFSLAGSPRQAAPENLTAPEPFRAVHTSAARVRTATLSAPQNVPQAAMPMALAPTVLYDALERSKQAYLEKHYDESIAWARQAVKEHPYAAWQLIGQAACMTSDEKLVDEAMQRLDVPRQKMVQFTCRSRQATKY